MDRAMFAGAGRCIARQRPALLQQSAANAKSRRVGGPDRAAFCEILRRNTPDLDFDKGRHFLPFLLSILKKLVMGERGIHDLGLPDFDELRLNGEVSDQKDTIYIHLAG